MADSSKLSQEQEAFLSQLFELIAKYRAFGVSGYNQAVQDAHGQSVYVVTVWVNMGNIRVEPSSDAISSRHD